MAATTTTATHSSAVPTKPSMNSAVITVTLIARIAATACAGGRRSNAAITNTEKAKNTPPITPAPTAAATVSTSLHVIGTV